MMAKHTVNDLFHGIDGHHLTLLRGNAVNGKSATMSEGHTLRTISIVMMAARSTAYEPLELKVVERLEEVLIVNLNLSFFQTFIGHPDILIIIAYLVGMRIQTTVGGDDTVAVEVIVGSRITAIVTTIGEDLLASNLTLVAQTLIHKIPDIATLIFRILTDDVPILLEATHRVTHRMGILTLNQRTGVIAFRIALTVIIVGIHRTENIRLTPVASLLILHRTGAVVSLHPIVGFLEVRTIASLVTQRPYDDTRMILERAHITLLALDMRLRIILTLGQRAFSITHTV